MKWTQADDNLDGATGVSIETGKDASRLVVSSVTCKLAGKVKVTAENSVGSDEVEFDVTVKGQ